MPDFPYEEVVTTLEPGETVVLYTDGVTEAMNSIDEEFGNDRLLGIFAGGTPDNAQQASDAVFEAVRELCRRHAPVRRHYVPDSERRRASTVSESISLRVKSDRAQLGEVIEAVEGHGGAGGVGPGLLVSRTPGAGGTGAQRHGLRLRRQHCRTSRFNVTSDSDAITIEIVDSGKPFDPLSDAPEPDLDAAVEERRIGGLGVHLVKTLMDQMHYKRENDQNRLTIVARRNPE